MRLIKGLLVIGLLLILAAGGFLVWARASTQARFARSWDVPAHPVPVPWPLTADEIEAVRTDRAAHAATQAAQEQAGDDTDDAGEDTKSAPQEDPPELTPTDLQKIATARAIERGAALVDTRLGCRECHGDDFGGKVVMDVAAVGRIAGPNITSGQGSVVKNFSSTDWVRILRHGINQRGQTSSMPAVDYESLSDREISDIIAYVRSYPPVDRTLEPSAMGPMLWIGYALGQLTPAAERIDHERARPRLPPVATVSVAYGEHVSKVCRGCHRMDYRGGPIKDGDPDWPPATNLTPHETGLKGWTKAQFIKAMREGIRPDGSKVDPVMPWPAMGRMGDVELQALHLFFQSLAPVPQGT